MNHSFSLVSLLKVSGIFFYGSERFISNFPFEVMLSLEMKKILRGPKFLVLAIKFKTLRLFFISAEKSARDEWEKNAQRNGKGTRDGNKKSD